MAIFDDLLRHLFAASSVQHVSDLHLKFALRPHHVCKYGRRLTLGEEGKKEEQRRTNDRI